MRDITPAPCRKDTWKADVRRLTEAHRELIEALSALDVSRLDEPIVPGFSSVYVFALHGLAQHTLKALPRSKKRPWFPTIPVPDGPPPPGSECQSLSRQNGSQTELLLE